MLLLKLLAYLLTVIANPVTPLSLKRNIKSSLTAQVHLQKQYVTTNTRAVLSYWFSRVVFITVLFLCDTELFLPDFFLCSEKPSISPQQKNIYTEAKLKFITLCLLSFHRDERFFFFSLCIFIFLTPYNVVEHPW